MQYKNILVYLDQGASNGERLKTAAAIAKTHEAQLTGIVVNAQPTARMMEKLGLAKGDAALKNIRSDADALIDDFSATMQAQGVNYDTRIIEGRESKVPGKLARLVRNYDIAILRQANPDKPNASFINELSEQVLFYSGRPVFFIPYIGAHQIPCRKGIIAWDGSAAATRAVHDALPLLEQMEEVTILVVDADKVVHNTDAAPGEDLSRHLLAHGITNKVEHVPSAGLGASTVILNAVADAGADILIMGGYGSPKLREMMLGGVTRTLFKSMTVPVVMSH